MGGSADLHARGQAFLGHIDSGHVVAGLAVTGQVVIDKAPAGQELPAPGSDRRWFAVHTKPRQERLAELNLARQGFQVFLPLADNPYQRQRRVGTPRAEPLFPRYLFIEAEPAIQSLAVVRSSRGVVGLVRAGLQPLQVPSDVVQALHARIEPDSGLIRLLPDALHTGDSVQVFAGPLAGLEGILAESCSSTRSALLLKLLGREMTIEVESRLLKRVG